MISKVSFYLIFLITTLFLLPNLALAHVAVTPSEVETSQNTTLSISVPTEKDVATVGLRIIIPDGVDRVRPVVKPGWKISLVKEADVIKEIIWSEGSIPPDQKDVFLFGARSPGAEATLAWKAYQTYQDGSVVAWDQDPKTIDRNVPGTHPYSETKVASVSASPQVSKEPVNPLAIASVALVLSLVSLYLQLRKRTG